MSEERNCYIHNTPTRLSCSSCNRPICPKCMISASVGYKCRECGKRNITHIEKITAKQWIIAIVVGLFVGMGVGFGWHQLKHLGMFASLLSAYAVGFCVSKAITKAIGEKIGLRIKLLTAAIVIISMVFNPAMYIYVAGAPVITAITMLTVVNLSCIINILAIGVAVWAAVRHFRF